MTCSNYQEILMDAARGLTETEALAHAASCEACGRVLANERTLSAGLRAAQRSIAGESLGPSAALEFALLAEFRPVRRRAGAAWWGWAAAAAVAAGLVVLGATMAHESARREPSIQTVVRPLIASMPKEFSAVRSVETSVAKVSQPSHRVRKRKPKAIDGEEPFISIPYAEPLAPTERAEIVRVNMQVGALAGLGLRLQGVDPTLRLNADLVLGQDGLARAVRFVR